MDLEATQQKYQDQLMQLPNVVGTGIGEKAGRKVIKVFVTHKVPASDLSPQELVPQSLEGHEIDVDEIGAVTAQNP